MNVQPTRRLFLGVERSATGRAWRDRLDEAALARSLAMVQRHGLPELLARVCAGRGVAVEDLPSFLDPALKRLMPDPNVVTDMSAAAKRLADAIGRKENVAIFGDYDVDGATASAVLARFLRWGS
jgi:single-stranded-DNA-specific exonuclease